MDLELFLNGELVKNVTEETHAKLNKWPSGGVFVIGQLQERLGSGFEKFQSFSGIVAGIQIWDFVQDETSMRRMAQCGGNFEGNVLSWSEDQWTVTGGINSSEVNADEFCNEPAEKNFIMIPQQQSVTFSKGICRKLGGQLVLPKTSEENALITEITRPYHKVCDVEGEGGKASWLRLVPDGRGRWNDPITRKAPQFSNWRKGKQGETDDNCAFILAGDQDVNTKWSSTTCNEQSPRTLCTMCQFRSSSNRFQLRGLCADSKHDTIYYFERVPGQMPMFKGLSSSLIQWNESRRVWTLVHLRYDTPGYLTEDPVVILIHSTTHSMLALQTYNSFRMVFLLGEKSG